MSVTFSTLSRATQVALKSNSATEAASAVIPLCHIHEALSAALGYNTHASLKAAIKAREESLRYDAAAHVVIDFDRLEERLIALNHRSLIGVVSGAILEAFAATLPEAKLHKSSAEIGDDIYGEVIYAIENSDDYSDAIAMTNAYGGDFDIAFTWSVPIEASSGTWALEAKGTSSLDSDPEKVFHGDTIDVRATVLFEKIGRLVLGEMSIDEAGGWLSPTEEDMDADPPEFDPPEE